MPHPTEPILKCIIGRPEECALAPHPSHICLFAWDLPTTDEIRAIHCELDALISQSERGRA